MKTIIAIGVSALLAGTSGYFIGQAGGYDTGHKAGYALREFEQSSKTYEELVLEVRERESSTISQFVDATTSMKRVDEGGLFNIKYNHYLTGAIVNKSVATPIKDIKLRVDFLSKTGSIISTDEITVFQIIRPGQESNFKEKIVFPEKAENYQFSIADVKLDY